MKTLTRFFFFILAFTLDVRVHAKIVQTPNGCIEQSGYCVMKAEGTKEVFTFGDVVISLKSDSTFVRQSLGQYSLVKGIFLFSSKETLEVETPYGKIAVEPNSKIIFEKKEDRVVLDVIFGKARMNPLGSAQPVDVLEGYENYMTGVDHSLKGRTGIPKPIIIEPTLKTWALLKYSSKDEFLKEVEDFKIVHKKAVHDLAILNQQVMQREIASVEAEKKAKIERIKNEENQKKARQDMYLRHLLEE